MFGVVPKVLWSKFAPPDERNRIALQTNCLLLRASHEASNDQRQRRVLIETGYGSKWNDKDRDIFALEPRTIVEALAEIDVTPDTITDVILTHLHFDHAGGLTRLNEQGEPISVFSNAVIHVQKCEWRDALANRSTMTKTYLRSHLDPIAAQTHLHEGIIEVLPGIIVEPMPGHTWGQQAVRFRDAEGIVCFPGDVLPTIHHVGLAFSMGYDMEPYTNMLHKRDLLERAERERWRLVLDHEPTHPIVTITREGDRFTLTPAALNETIADHRAE